MIYSNKDDISRSEKIRNCYFVRTVLMLLVILYHSCVFWRGDWFTAVKICEPNKILQVFPIWLASFHIYGFTLVSGFVFSYLDKNNHYANWKCLLTKKVKRLIIPYAVICVVWIIPITCFFYNYSLNEIVKRYFLGINPSQLWFLLMLFDVFVLSCFFKRAYSKSFFTAIIICIISYAVGSIGLAMGQNVFQVWTALTYFPLFVLGYWLYKKDYNINWVIYFILHTITFILLFTIPNTKIGMVLENITQFLNHIFGAVMSFGILQKLAHKVNCEESVFWNLLSKNSMTIYLFHQQIIYFAIYYMNDKFNVLVIAVLSFFISTILSLIISIVLNHFKITKFLLGN